MPSSQVFAYEVALQFHRRRKLNCNFNRMYVSHKRKYAIDHTNNKLSLSTEWNPQFHINCGQSIGILWEFFRKNFINHRCVPCKIVVLLSLLFTQHNLKWATFITFTIISNRRISSHHILHNIFFLLHLIAQGSLNGFFSLHTGMNCIWCMRWVLDRTSNQ